MRIELRKFESVAGAFDRFPKELGKLGTTIIRKGARYVEREAKKQAPVDTGNLRSSIYTRFEDAVGIVGPNVRYAKYVHGGTGQYSGGKDQAPGARWNRLRTEYSKGRRIVPPVNPGGIRPDKFMNRAAELSEGQINEMVEIEINKFLAKI